jgi:hypothetical protein
MGDKQDQPFQLSFNASLKIDLQGSRVTSDGGLILVRELDDRLGLGELIAQHLTDSRCGIALTSRLQSFETGVLSPTTWVACGGGWCCRRGSTTGR